MSQPERAATPSRHDDARGFVARGFTLVEDVVYVGLGVLLSVSTVVLLGSTAVDFARTVSGTPLPNVIVALLDRVLLVLMIVELLYTVQVSFREHALVPEPFLIVGLVAAIRRVLVITAEFSTAQPPTGDAIRVPMVELGLLTVMIVAFVVSLVLLRRRHPNAVATRA